MPYENKQIRSEIYITKGDAPTGVVSPKKENPNSLETISTNTDFEEKSIQDSWNEFEMARHGNQMTIILLSYLIYKF